MDVERSKSFYRAHDINGTYYIHLRALFAAICYFHINNGLIWETIISLYKFTA